MIGITNAVNFLDGMDGLAAGSSAINSAFFALVALQTGQPFMMLLSIALMGSCMGFLPYNFRRLKPASIFLGDSCSNFLGFTLAGIGILGEWGTNNLVGLAVPILILSVSNFDTTLPTVVRFKSGQVRSFSEWIRFTGRDHFHHRRSDLGFGNKTAVWIIYLISVWLGLEAFVTKNARGIDAIFSLLKVSIIFILIGSFMVFVQHRYERLAQVRRMGPRIVEREISLCSISLFFYLYSQNIFLLSTNQGKQAIWQRQAKRFSLITRPTWAAKVKRNQAVS